MLRCELAGWRHFWGDTPPRLHQFHAAGIHAAGVHAAGIHAAGIHAAGDAVLTRQTRRAHGVLP